MPELATMTLDDDTIVAVATPAGRGALSMIRVSGREAHDICRRVLEPWPAEARRATLCTVREPAAGTVVDRVIALVYEAPRSYTGEAMVEIIGHGGVLSPLAIVSLLGRSGARQARPGEFTQRAVLNGKLDLLQAESIADVVDARTEAMRRAALFHLDGGLSGRISELRAAVLELEALLAYEIDFPEEDAGPVPRPRILEALGEVVAGIQRLLSTVTVGEVVRDGAVVVIAGRPNVGKSSLFNALLGYRRAIVADLPGTTRDALEALIETDRWPFRLVDTAGLREGGDPVEREGVEVSRRYLGAAHIALVCDDRLSELPQTVATVTEMTSAPIVAVRTKVDLEGSSDGKVRAIPGVDALIEVSAVTREGLADVIEAIQQVLDARIGVPPDTPVLTRARHRAALERANEELMAFRTAWSNGLVPAPIAAVHVRSAAHALEELIGAVDVEDVLQRVFAAFCIGK
jgi:tRNA modification GTPase